MGGYNEKMILNLPPAASCDGLRRIPGATRRPRVPLAAPPSCDHFAARPRAAFRDYLLTVLSERADHVLNLARPT